MIVVVCVRIGWAWRMCVGVGACVREWVSGESDKIMFSAVVICLMDVLFCFCPLCLLSST